MVNDEVGIYNLALNQIGSRNNVSSTTEKSREAEVCNLWYPVVRDQILRAAHWPSCRKIAQLAVLAQTTPDTPWDPSQPEPGYAWSYGQPSDMLYPRFLSNYAPFIINNVGETPALTTNVENAILIYTFRNPNVLLWESSLQSAIAEGLAAYICMPLTAKPARAKQLLDNANSMLISAQTEAANEGSKQLDTLPDWITARGYRDFGDGHAHFNTRFLYPYGAVLGPVGGTSVR